MVNKYMQKGLLLAMHYIVDVTYSSITGVDIILVLFVKREL